MKKILDGMKKTMMAVKPPRYTALEGLQKAEASSPFKILIGTVLSARTKDENTTKRPEDYLTNSLLCGRITEEFWLLANLNCTYFEIPDYVHFVCRTSEDHFRQVKGHKYYLDYY